jgi:hypothetical protein
MRPSLQSRPCQYTYGNRAGGPVAFRQGAGRRRVVGRKASSPATRRTLTAFPATAYSSTFDRPAIRAATWRSAVYGERSACARFRRYAARSPWWWRRSPFRSLRLPPRRRWRSLLVQTATCPPRACDCAMPTSSRPPPRPSRGAPRVRDFQARKGAGPGSGRSRSRACTSIRNGTWCSDVSRERGRQG